LRIASYTVTGRLPRLLDWLGETSRGTGVDTEFRGREGASDLAPIWVTCAR
jgi:hypothetical protein